VALKKDYPQLKIMVSIGGWGGCAPCSDVFADSLHRQHFAKTTVALFKQYGIDGLDLDWEYPAIEGYPGHKYDTADKNNFTALVTTLRKEMGTNYLLSFAAGGFTQYLQQSVDWDAVTPQVDFINLMTYDLVNGYATLTGHHTPLYSYQPGQQSAATCVKWLKAKKIPAHKLIIGAAMYARVWQNVPDTNNGLYQPGIFKQTIPYRLFNNYFADSTGFKLYWDKKAKASYQYNTAQQLFATFDDSLSIKEKTKFIRRKKMGGIMFWQLLDDATAEGLVSEMWRGLGK
jgi:chitinase